MNAEFPSGVGDFANIENGPGCPGDMGNGDKACARRYQVSDGFKNGTVSIRSQVGETHHNASTITKLVEGCKQAHMFVIGGNNFISSMPINTIADDIQALAGVVGQSDLALVSVE